MTFRVSWKKGGLNATCVGIRNTRTGALRGLTQREVDDLISKFEGKDKLEEPFSLGPFIPEEPNGP
jgi:hypothetical protein